MRKSSPCQNCTKRCLHCHSVCTEYIEYRNQQLQVYEEKIVAGKPHHVKRNCFSVIYAVGAETDIRAANPFYKNFQEENELI